MEAEEQPQGDSDDVSDGGTAAEYESRYEEMVNDYELTRRDIGRAGVVTMSMATIGSQSALAQSGAPYQLRVDADIPSSTGVKLTVKAGQNGSANDSTTIDSSTVMDGDHTYDISSLSFNQGDELWVEGEYTVDTATGQYPVINEIAFENNFSINGVILRVDATIPENAEWNISVYSSDRRIEDQIAEFSLETGEHLYQIPDQFVNEDAALSVEGEIETEADFSYNDAKRMAIHEMRFIKVGNDPSGTLALDSPEGSEDAKMDLGPKLPTLGKSFGGIESMMGRSFNVARDTAKYASFIGFVGGMVVWILDTNDSRSQYAYTVVKFSVLILILYLGFEGLVALLRFVGEGMGQGL